MADRPIIFSAPMVRALLAGRKTQTRRLAWRPRHDYEGQAPLPSPWQSVQRGAQLWVREAWRVGAWRRCNGTGGPGQIAVDYRASPEESRTPWLDVPDPMWKTLHDQSCADAAAAAKAGRGSARALGDGWKWERGDSPCRWRPSIHMPRWASRLTLTVTEVRVERLQDISEGDAAAEGMVNLGGRGLADCWWHSHDGLARAGANARSAFGMLWDDLHAPPHAWADNLSVVVLTFAVHRRNIDQEPA